MTATATRGHGHRALLWVVVATGIVTLAALGILGPPARSVTNLKLDSSTGYSGSMIDGLANGQGEIEFPDGARFTGSFVRGRFDGQGTLTMHDGWSISGRFTAGQLDPGAVVEGPDGSQYPVGKQE
jgi:hypothetical protein